MATTESSPKTTKVNVATKTNSRARTRSAYRSISGAMALAIVATAPTNIIARLTDVQVIKQAWLLSSPQNRVGGGFLTTRESPFNCTKAN